MSPKRGIAAMASVCFYFQVHQPLRLRRYSVFDTDRHYFDDYKNAEIVRKVAQKCYLPANKVILETIKAHEGRFRVAYCLTGIVLDQFQQYAPDVLQSFDALNKTGCVEFLNETYHHSLSFMYAREEFRAQVEMHRKKVKELFGQDARVFRNTELIYNNDLGHFVSHMGYDAILTEGADTILGHRSPNHVYRPPHSKIRLLLKNYRLSDDIAFRFSNRAWEQWPLTAEKFGKWVTQINGNGVICNLFMDYETFGEHQWANTGIFDFLRHVPGAVMKASQENNFLTPSELIDRYEPAAEIDVPHAVSWADTERDLSAWLGNAMQTNALNELYKLESALKQKADPQLLEDWRRLTTSDHFYYMCTKYWADGDVHKYFSPYESPYDSYINFMNVLDNIQARLRE
jgi:alpha-amylase